MGPENWRLKNDSIKQDKKYLMILSIIHIEALNQKNSMQFSLFQFPKGHGNLNW
jgi:hypothetical protein